MEGIGITPDDEEQIKNYLAKPPHLRDFNDLVPDKDSRAD